MGEQERQMPQAHRDEGGERPDRAGPILNYLLPCRFVAFLSLFVYFPFIPFKGVLRDFRNFVFAMKVGFMHRSGHGELYPPYMPIDGGGRGWAESPLNSEIS